jgi:hypothetical protein
LQLHRGRQTTLCSRGHFSSGSEAVAFDRLIAESASKKFGNAKLNTGEETGFRPVFLRHLFGTCVLQRQTVL